MTSIKRLVHWMRRLTSLSVLALIMVFIGLFTAYASANTYEVITNHDIAVSDVVKSIRLSSDKIVNNKLVKTYSTTYNPGLFGIPENITFPETDRHISIAKATYQDGQWKATRGIAQTFLSANPRQKMFGEAFIYMRVNTLTTKNLGHVYAGDLVDIVTTQGWQLGYQVTSTGTDISRLTPPNTTAESEIVVILIDDSTGSTSCFNAYLTKVGERA